MECGVSSSLRIARSSVRGLLFHLICPVCLISRGSPTVGLRLSVDGLVDNSRTPDSTQEIARLPTNEPANAYSR